MTDYKKNYYKTKLEERQELDRRNRQIQKNKVIAESNVLSFDDFILFFIVTIALILYDVLGTAF